MKVRVVPTKVHGAIDYATGPVLAFAPELFRMRDGRSASLPPRLAGLGGAAASALSDHELAARRVLPMRAHLLVDAATGAALAAAPWLGGSARRGTRHWLPHALVGAAEVGLAVTTKTQPADRRRLPRVPGRAAAVAAAAGLLAGGGWYALSRLGGRRRRPDAGEPETT